MNGSFGTKLTALCEELREEAICTNNEPRLMIQTSQKYLYSNNRLEFLLKIKILFLLDTRQNKNIGILNN